MLELITILLLILIMLLLHLIGRVQGIHLQVIDEYLETFEEVDFRGAGKQKTPYIPWEGDSGRIRIGISLQYAKTNYPLNWKLPISVGLEGLQLPDGFDGYIRTLEGGAIYAPDFRMRVPPGKYDRRHPFQIIVEIKKNTPNAKLPSPFSCSFSLRAQIEARRILPANHSAVLTYPFYIGPAMGDVWLGLDPGTTGSCIVSGRDTSSLFIEQNETGQDLIIPSIIAFDKREDFQLKQQNGLLDDRLYKHGYNAETVKLLSYFSAFQSIKKMLGYKDHQVIRFENRSKLTLGGKELTTLLINRLFEDHKRAVESDRDRHKPLLHDDGEYRPERAVVAIPNNFTATQIQALIDSLKALERFREVRYIHEAEAICIYYLFNHAKPHSNKSGDPAVERILIFDMGGATMNLTLVRSTRSISGGQTRFHMEILGKLGYGIGGDTIDYCLVKFLYAFRQQYPELANVNPFRSTKEMTEAEKDAQLLTRKKLMDAAFHLKKKIIENYNDYHKNYLLKSWEIEEILRDFSISITINEADEINTYLKQNKRKQYPLFEDQDMFFKGLIYNNVRAATRDVLTFSRESVVDTVIFAGRSTLFPGIREAVREELEKQRVEAYYPDFDEGELKSAVAKGACLYGVAGYAIDLVNLKTNCTFGIKKTIGPKEMEFVKLVDFGVPFQARSGMNKPKSVVGEQKIVYSFDWDSHFVNFFQVMGTNPQQILLADERHKYSLLESIKVAKRTEKIGMQIFENDDIACVIMDSDGNRHEKRALIADQEIADAHHEHYTWIIR